MIHRIELFAVRSDAPAGAVERLESALLDAPRHTSITRATLGRSGTLRHGWSHVWEQDYDDAAALDAYMADAHHWAVLDPFFDATNPGSVVDRVTVAAYDTASAEGGDGGAGEGLRRLLLIRLDTGRDGAAATVREAILGAAPLLPLRGSRVAPLLPHRHGWSLVWEQTFAAQDALAEYMRHPAHWAGVDPLFDAENPAVVVAETTMAWYPLPGVAG